MSSIETIRWVNLAIRLARQPTQTLRGSDARVRLYEFRASLDVDHFVVGDEETADPMVRRYPPNRKSRKRKQVDSTGRGQGLPISPP